MTYQTRKNLNAQALIHSLIPYFQKIKDPRSAWSIPLSDIIMSGLAVFQLKIPSLLLLDELRDEEHAHANLKRLFSITQVPSDTQLRDILDRIPTEELRTPFDIIFRTLKQDKSLEQYKFHDGHRDTFLLNIDATGVFSSTNIKCDCCLVKIQKGQDEEGEELLYHHQLLGATIVKPGMKTVIPLCPELITQQDGSAKNDCEINAAKRLYFKIRQSHPKLHFTVNQDALYANVPNIQELKKHNLSFIIVAKKDKKSLFRGMEARRNTLGDVTDITEVSFFGDKVEKKKTVTYSFVNDIPLSGSNEEISVNLLCFKETIEWVAKTGSKKGKIQKEEVEYAWITDIELDTNNVKRIAEAGRSRWKIENEAFNTLKNQGYRLEHNYGHGKKFLANNFAMLAMIAFLIDQVQETHCEFFKNTLTKWKGKRSRVWKLLEFAFCLRPHNSWAELWLFLAKGSRTANTC